MSLSIEATPNYSKRTFTIRFKCENELFSKYRTTKMSRDDFESSLYNTENDWHHFLRANEVIIIKQ